MRVVLTCDFLLKYAIAQAIGLTRAGAEVLLVCRDHAKEFGGDRAERARALHAAEAAGVRVLEIPGRLPELQLVPALLRLRTSITRFRPQVAHAHDGSDPRALALLPQVPLVLTLHDPVEHPGHPVPPLHKRWFLHGARDAWRRRAAAIVVHSERLREEVAFERPGRRVVTIAHGLEVQSRPLDPPAAPTLSLFGRLTAYKGLEVLADAMPRVWEARPDARLLVCGAGEAGWPLGDPRVQVERRYVPEAEVPALFARTSLLVLPYTQASQTGVGSLAAGYGVPMVASRLGGLPDLALDDSYLVEPGDPQALARALLAHLDDGPDVRARVLAQVARPRSWEAVGAQTIELYRSLLSRR